MEFAGSTLSGLQRVEGFCKSVVNSGRADGYYVELIGIKGLNCLSNHFINREWIAVCERFTGGVDQILNERRIGSIEIESSLALSRCRQEMSNKKY